MSEERFYFCYGDTTPVLDEVIEAMIPFFKSKYGLASSDYGHSFGVEAAEAMNHARSTVAESIGAKPEEIIFTSGGTEANNLALKGIAYAARKRNKGNHIITSKIEQSSILDTCEALEKEGFQISYLDVDASGFLKPQQVAAAIREDTILVTIQHGNGEIGTIQDIQAIGKICRQQKVPFHTDAVQSFCKVPINVEEMNIDLLTISAHLIYGPKGIGALYTRKGIRLAKLIHGGLYERNLRGGTENIPAIIGFGKAVELHNWSNIEKIRELRQYLVQRITNEIEDVLVTGPEANRLPHVASFVIHFIEGESLLLHLDMRGFSVATGSACSTKKLKASHVLTALGIPQEVSHGSLRMTLGLGNSKDGVDKLVEALKEVVERLREISPMNPEVMKKWQKTGEI
ncbi:MAG: cysteine desulfurase family protein [Candidatus Thorarchaeota archaeon]